MNLPASEFVEWQAYFNIYPFTIEREDQRHAELVSALTYISSMSGQGKYLKKAVSAEDLIPDYLGERDKPKVVKKSKEQQRAEFAAFVNKHKELEKAVKKV